MSITNEDVKKVAKLARLKFSEAEVNSFASQLDSIMKMIDEINDVDCSNIEPLASVCDMNLRLRADEVDNNITREELFLNVPGKDSDVAKEIKCFIVPKMVE